ncbi:HipA domain-containing protein [soil metagenome]
MPDTIADVLVQVGDEELLAGRLWSHRRRNTESATFAYDAGYLAHPEAYALDPGLRLATGQQQTAASRPIFGAFSDCAPDRWGRRLVDRAEGHRVRDEGDGAERSFGEADYLLSVRDDLRQGALRFRDPESGAYLASEKVGVPHLVELPMLLSASERMERDQATAAELQALLDGGSSLGGARPKAHVLGGDGRVAIAKFPSPAADEWDVMRWEWVALQLARQAGIRVPDSKLHVVDDKPVLVVDRFDRVGSRRLGYVSAMTMLEAADGDQGSYLDIAGVIGEHSPAAAEDLRELWRRIAFSVLIRNTDDHLRNHGFLRVSTAGWSLSPAFDINPDPRPGPKHLSTAVDYETSEAHIDVVLGVAGMFRLRDIDAQAVLREVTDAAARWRAVAADAGLESDAIDKMRRAFEHDQTERARAMVMSSAHPRR